MDKHGATDGDAVKRRNLQFRFAHWVPKMLRVGAIVLYPYVLFAKPSSQIHPQTFRHEYEHVRQIRRLGFLRFYAHYIILQIWGTILQLSFQKAYENNPYEIEAYEIEATNWTLLSPEEQDELNRHFDASRTT